ncbi:protein singed-like [Saccostrea cucullata]|uniref:protein singed-like n=1 Tax=Saccostrea cuccullata TaxID=36930 RepID=UPI002ED5F217
MSSENVFEWKVGLINVQEKYLTADGYGNKVNASGTALRQKQMWTIEFHEDETVYIRSYSRNYISVDRLGNVTCDAKERGEEQQFSLTYATDGSARWAFQNKKLKQFLAGMDEKIDCLAKKATEEDLSLWTVPFAMHPQVTLFAMFSKKFALADSKNVQIGGDKAWGAHALFTMEFYCGKYQIKTPDNRYLCKDGSLVQTHGKDTVFGIEIHQIDDRKFQGLAFKDNEGKFLSTSGPTGILKSFQKNLKREGLFRLQQSHPQVSIVGPGGKMATVGMEVMMKKLIQDPTNSEIFQLEYESKKKKWSIETYDGTFWGVGPNGQLNTNSKSVSEDTLFEIIWLSNGKVSIKGPNGKRLVSKGTGNLVANLPEDVEDEGFQIRIQNRPVVVLRCDFGFIGIKTATGSNKDEYICTKPTPSVITLNQMEDGRYSLQSENGKYWCINLQTGGHPTIKANSAEPVPFVIEFRDTNAITILAPNERYMVCDKVGHFYASATEICPKCMLYF